MFVQKAITLAMQNWIEHVREHTDVAVRIVLPNEQKLDLGKFDRPKVCIYPKEPTVLLKLAQGGLDSLGEAYVEGDIDVQGKIDDIIEAAYKMASIPAIECSTVMKMLGGAHRYTHTKEQDRTAITYHYDVSNKFYSKWLDQRMVYSCAYFPTGEEDLDTAQYAKIDHILTKIRLKAGQTLLDIGCGWGALVIRAATKFNAKCVGITLSEQQFLFATEQVRNLGLSHLVEIRLEDYRDTRGQFDRITSVGMFEHVGLNNLDGYFAAVNSLLKPDGIVMNHGITSTDCDNGDTPYGGGEFIDKYVFPQGELPHLSYAIRAMQKGGLEVFDVENLRRHYAKTLQHWSENFERNAEALRTEVGEKKFRIWRIYLAGCRQAFEIDNVSIYQIVSSKSCRQAFNLPWSREHMYPGKQTLSPSICVEKTQTVLNS